MIRTPWGYEVDADKLPPIIDPATLAEYTQGAFGPETVGAYTTLAAVSAAVRAACGWHVAPVLTCVERTEGPGRVLSLRTLALASVGGVTECGAELAPGDYEVGRSGSLRRACWRSWPDAYGSVVVTYESGFDPDAVPDLAAVVAQIAANALAAPAGVRAEQAGDVSVTYNTTASGVSGGVRLLDSDLAMLAPYAIDGLWS